MSTSMDPRLTSLLLAFNNFHSEAGYNKTIIKIPVVFKIMLIYAESTSTTIYHKPRWGWALYKLGTDYITIRRPFESKSDRNCNQRLKPRLHHTDRLWICCIACCNKSATNPCRGDWASLAGAMYDRV